MTYAVWCRTRDFYDEIVEMNRDLDLQYVMDRLRAFHRFMCREYAIEDADWDELDSGSTVPHGSPGTLGRPQYDNALKLLADRPSKRPYQDVACAALLILAFRFGLRGNDAIGLLRRDCWSSGKMIVLLVRPNRLRQLKRTSSRRVVPLIESLSKREIAILLRFRDQVLGLSKDNEAFALFGLDQAGNHFDLGDLRKRINTTLQFVCDDKAITLHKARHAFACRIAEYLLGLMLRAPPMHGGRSTEIKQIEHIQNLLLSTVQPTRRSCWAVSRLLGHWRPRTSFKSYVHQLPEWADTWSQHLIDGLDQEVGVNGLSHAVRLDDAPYRAWEPILTSMTLEETDAPVTPGCVAAYLDLLRRGASHASAKRPTRLSRELAEAVEQCLEFATEKVRKRTERLGRAPLISLLHQISDPEWSAIIERCGDARSQWNVANFSSHPETMGTGMQLLSENRQLVMWREWHFKLMASFIQLFGIGKGDVCIARTGRLHLTVMQWLTASKLEEFCSTDGVANLQIDAVEEGDPPRTFPHRCSVFVRPAPSGFLKTGFGLALLWVIFVACNEVREKANPNTA